LGQEFIIKSQDLEDKINQLLPSQGGFQAGVDLSASTQIIPIVDLTETAEGSLLRQDLQSSYSHTSSDHNEFENSGGTIVTTTGYYRCLVNYSILGSSGGADSTVKLEINDGTTDKVIWQQTVTNSSATPFAAGTVDFIVFLPAGHSLKADSSRIESFLNVTTRQIATIDGNLVNPQ
tara:strand:+ start:119 stop:649 length:531 start_codon:yes stop_codon:yes gene_type:complete